MTYLLAQNGRNIDNGGVMWNSPDLIQENDTVVNPTCSIKNNFSDLLVGYNFGFSIPSVAQILGVEAIIKKGIMIDTADVYDYTVQICINQIPVGDNLAKTLDNWVTSVNNFMYEYEDVYYGGLTDTWGLSLTAADINNSNFGIGIAAVNLTNIIRNAKVINIKSRIHYKVLSHIVTSGWNLGVY